MLVGLSLLPLLASQVINDVCINYTYSRSHPENNGSQGELDCEFGKFKSNPGI